MAVIQRAGKGGRAAVGASNVKGKQWTVEHKGDDLDVTNFESNGKDEGTIGIEGCDWSLEGDWISSANPWEDPPGLYPRDDLASVKLYENVSDNVFWSFATSRVLSARNSAPVRGLVSFACSCKSNGVFTVPAGNV